REGLIRTDNGRAQAQSITGNRNASQVNQRLTGSGVEVSSSSGASGTSVEQLIASNVDTCTTAGCVFIVSRGSGQGDAIDRVNHRSASGVIEGAGRVG